MGLVSQVNGNGGAYLNGGTSEEVKSKVLTDAVANLTTAGLEAARKASGKSWLAFYAVLAWAWLKKNWLWVLVPLGSVVIGWKTVKYFRKRGTSKKVHKIYKRK